jgi:hypothetical protein
VYMRFPLRPVVAYIRLRWTCQGSRDAGFAKQRAPSAPHC